MTQAFHVDNGTYQTAAGSPPPVVVLPGPVPHGGSSPVDFAAAAFGASTNGDLAGTNGEITADDADRRGHVEDAAAKFPDYEADAVSEFEGLDGAGMAQMMPQLISGMAGGIAGALGGLLSPITQVPQQLMQAGQGAVQPLMSAMQSAGEGSGDAGLLDELSDDELLGLGGGDISGYGGGDEEAATGGGEAGGTTPTGYMGAPPVPSSSPPTTPAAAPSKPVMMAAGGSTPTPVGPTGAGMMPMMPPGVMGAGVGDNKDKKTAEKRIAVPGVPNGQPVKGRMTVPPDMTVTKSGEPPKAAGPVTRRVVTPPSKGT